MKEVQYDKLISHCSLYQKNWDEFLFLRAILANSTVSVDWEQRQGKVEGCISEPKDYLFSTRTSQIDARVKDIPLEMKTQATLWELHTGKILLGLTCTSGVTEKLLVWNSCWFSDLYFYLTFLFTFYFFAVSLEENTHFYQSHIASG